MNNITFHIDTQTAGLIFLRDRLNIEGAFAPSILTTNIIVII